MKTSDDPATTESQLSVSSPTEDESRLRALDRAATREDIVSAYHFLLGRAPESSETVNAWLGQGTTIATLRDLILDTDECKQSLLTPYATQSKWIAADIPSVGQLWLDLRDRGVSLPALSGNYEPNETAYFQSQLRHDTVFLDIGANIGWYSLMAVTLGGPDVVVEAFEPHPVLARYLRRSLYQNAMLEQVRLHEIALDDASGAATIGHTRDTRNTGHSWLLTEAEAAQPNAYEGFQALRAKLDDLPINKPPTLVKIDVEGAELRALRGAADMLSLHRPQVIAEVFPDQLKRISGVSSKELFSFMNSFGYSAFQVVNGARGRAISDYPDDANGEIVTVAFVNN